MFNYIKKIDSAFGIFGSFIFFLCLGVFFQGNGYSDQFNVLVSTAAFLFGIFVAFSISAGHSTLNKLHEVLKSDEAQLLSVYQFSEVFVVVPKECVATDQQNLHKAYLEGWDFSSGDVVGKEEIKKNWTTNYSSGER